MDVTHERVKMPVVPHEKGLIAPLEQVADPAVTTVEPRGVVRLSAPDDPREGAPRPCGGEVDVIGHEAVGQQLEAEVVPAAGEPTQVLLAIDVVANRALRSLPRAVT